MSSLSTPGARLQSLLDEKSPNFVMSVVAFAEAMMGRTPRPTGSTKAMIYRYLKRGAAAPPVDFLEAASDVLKVEPAWLAFGIGYPNKSAAAADVTPVVTDLAAQQRERTQRMVHEILIALGLRQADETDVPFWRSPASHLPAWAAPIGEVRNRLGHYMLIDSPESMFDYRAQIEKSIGEALQGPLSAIGVDAGAMEAETLSDYILAMVPSLLVLVAEKTRQRQAEWAAESARRNHEFDEAREPTQAPATKRRRR